MKSLIFFPISTTDCLRTVQEMHQSIFNYGDAKDEMYAWVARNVVYPLIAGVPVTRSSLRNILDTEFDGERYFLTSEFLTTLPGEMRSLYDTERILGIGVAEYFLVMQGSVCVGITGFYSEPGNTQVCHLGWFGVMPVCRGKGFGALILKETMIKARKAGFKKMEIWTSSLREESNALGLYQSKAFGFVAYKAEIRTGSEIIDFFLSRDISGVLLEEKIDIPKPKPKKGGVFIPSYCKCGNYKAKSTSGVIDLRCKNCGGEKNEPIFG